MSEEYTPKKFKDRKFVSVLYDKAVDKAIESAAQVFNWDASGLTNMFPPMGVSVGLSTLFYAVFGKRG